MNESIRRVPLFAQISDELLLWIEGKGQERELANGERLFIEGEAATHFYVLLEGALQITKKMGGREVTLATHQAGAFTGEVPLLTGTPYVASARAIGPSRLLSIQADDFHHLLTLYPPMVGALLTTLASRVQTTESLVQHNEKLAGLGKLSAGLAHELNNPATAARRAVEQMRMTIQAQQASTFLLYQELTPEQWQWLAQLRVRLRAQAAEVVQVDPLAQSDLEEALTAWFDAQTISDGWKLALGLGEVGLDIALLTTIKEHLTPATLEQALIWLEATLTMDKLLHEMEQSTIRIADIVKAIKEYSYMDRARQQEVDVHEGIDNTLTILNHKLRDGITVIRTYDRNLPRIQVYGSELNQVWTNILDNAIDALRGHGHIWIRTSRAGAFMHVEITDDGPGIPTEIQSHIFEPFFTTKGVGEGTGLGLDIAYRIVVTNHHGDLSVSSRPGETRFLICLPLN